MEMNTCIAWNKWTLEFLQDKLFWSFYEPQSRVEEESGSFWTRVAELFERSLELAARFFGDTYGNPKKVERARTHARLPIGHQTFSFTTMATK